jgi:hypothetical protein
MPDCFSGTFLRSYCSYTKLLCNFVKGQINTFENNLFLQYIIFLQEDNNSQYFFNEFKMLKMIHNHGMYIVLFVMRESSNWSQCSVQTYFGDAVPGSGSIYCALQIIWIRNHVFILFFTSLMYKF